MLKFKSQIESDEAEVDSTEKEYESESTEKSHTNDIEID